jgi:hypothetical protein
MVEAVEELFGRGVASLQGTAIVHRETRRGRRPIAAAEA